MTASVCIIGCGGAGNIVTQHLVSAGIQKFILIDDDRIEQNNFNRQFCFDTQDLGEPKAVALKNYILARNPQAEVHIYCEKINSTADIARLIGSADIQPNLIIGCADTPLILIQTFI